MLVDFGKGSFLQKAKQQPDKVKEVLAKVKTDGLAPTIAAVKNKLEQPIPLGYCNVGTVIEVGRDVTEFKLGDRVVPMVLTLNMLVFQKILLLKFLME